MNKKLANKLFVILVAIIFIVPKYVIAETVSRSTLEDYVVSTALSYFYNNSYTDYEGYWADETHSIYATNYNITPEMLSRSRRMTTQCEAFAITTYMHSLGYDLTDYYGVLSSSGLYTHYKDSNGTAYYGNTSPEIMKNLYKYFNKGYNVGMHHKIARDYPDDDIVIATYQQGVTSTFPGITDYSQTITDMSEADKNTLISDLEQMLKPGDIIFNDGHAMLWVGDALEDEGGIIHSSGSSFAFEEDGSVKYSGYDYFSVRYSDKDYLINNQVINHASEANDKLTIIRPINKFCGKNSDSCEISSIQDNTKARSIFKNLKIEGYVYNATDETVMSVDSSSLNKGDLLSYRLVLKNESGVKLCSKGTHSCNGGVWKKGNNSQNYSNIKIIAPIPEGTEFVECNNGCSVNSDGTVSWENISITAEDGEVNYNYTVRPVVDNTTIVNDGIEVGIAGNSSEYTLKTGTIKTRINDSIIGKYKSKLKKMVDSDLKDENLKNYDSPQDYVADLYQRFYLESPSVPINAFYDILDADNIKNAIFKQNTFDEYYTRKTKADINALDETGKAINEMLVPYFYGGKKYEQLYYENNMDYYYRIKPLYSSRINFNYGDIIVTLKEEGGSYKINNALLYTGLSKDNVKNETVPVYTFYEDSKLIGYQIDEDYKGTGKTIYSNVLLLSELYSADLYVVLRPSQYYGLDDIDVSDEEIIIEPSDNPKTGSFKIITIITLFGICLISAYLYYRKISKKDK